jgi:O-antigen/teichoic acid export membrane protein
MNLVIKDAVWQIAWRVASAIWGFLVIKLITPYLWPLRFGDYSTILKYFAIRSAFADFGVYVIALKELGVIKKKSEIRNQKSENIMQNSIWDLSHWGHSKCSATAQQSGTMLTHDTSTSSVWQTNDSQDRLSTTYSKFVTTRFLMIVAVYTSALVIAYLIPAYSSNPYLIRWLPLGMVFSATFMASWILQLPLQLFWKMEQVSIALILARISQLWVIVGTIYRFYTQPGFEQGFWQEAFALIIASVVVSGTIQMIYTRWQWSKYLWFSWNLDRGFIKRIIWWNRQYGVAYYLSSFHTLLVLMVFSRLYPTTQGFTYVGVWALALSLVEILLIVPSALGNSLIHDVSWHDRTTQKNRYSNLLNLVVRIWCFVMIMCVLFSPHVINFMWWSDYLTTATTIWSDFILPFLSFVLVLSFIRQVHNYLFVTTGHQNALLWINVFGVSVWLIVWLPLIIRYGIAGWIVTQILLEVLFVWWALRVAHRNKISLEFPWKTFLGWLVVAGVAWIRIAPLLIVYVNSFLIRVGIAVAISLVIIGWSWNYLKKTMRQL